jgi:nucleotide-binding universal stress UspA family protein
MESRFGTGAVIVGLLPAQDPAVLQCAAELAAATGVRLAGAYVDPASYLIEWDPEGNVDGKSLDPALDPDDDALQAAHELEALLRGAAGACGVAYSFRTLGGDPAMALGRLAAAMSASAIVVGTRRPGVAAGVSELVGGSVARKLFSTQHVPVVVVPRTGVRPVQHG